LDQIAEHPSENDHRDVASAEFRAALQKITSAVIIIASASEGKSFGQTLTSSAIAVASAEPPTLVISLNATAPITQKLRSAGCLSVNYVSEDQHEIVRELLDPNLTSARPFERKGLWQRQETGSPVLSNSVVSMDCSVLDTLESGANVLFIVRVRSIMTSDRESLLYRDGLLRRLDTDF